MAFATSSPSTPADPPSARPGRVLLLSTDMGLGGGAEEQVIRLAYAIESWGWKTAIVSLVPPSPMPPGFEGRGIPLWHLNMRRAMPDPRGVLRLARLIREFAPDVVHSHMVHANLLARAARLIQPFPVQVSTHHNLTMAGIHRDWTGLFERAHRITDRLADHSTAISHSAAAYYVRRKAVPAAKIEVVPNGIDTHAYEPDAGNRERIRRELGIEGGFVWLNVARLVPAKAHATLLHAFAKLDDRPRTLLICGKGALREELESLASSLGIADRVKFLGLRSDIPAVMSAADAFALSSDLEGLPLVLLQAAAAALPIVATDVGGNTEVVFDGQNGEVVKAGDPEAFAAAMARMEDLPEPERLRRGLEGQTRVQSQFEAERVAERWKSLYEALIQRSGGAPSRFARRSPSPAQDVLPQRYLFRAPMTGAERGLDHAR